LVKAGELTLARELLEESVAWFEASHLTYTRSLVALRLGECYLAEGQVERARELLERVLETSRERHYRHCEAVAERLLGECFLGEDPARATMHLATAASMLEEIDARHDLAKVFVLKAVLAKTTGLLEEARVLLQGALEIFEVLDRIHLSARCCDGSRR